MEGLRIGVTGARKAAELAAALERRGAVAVVGPMVTSDQPVPDEVILEATDAIVAAGPDWLAASTGVGMRLWAGVTDRHGRYDELRGVLACTRVVARGAKAVGGLAAFDLPPEHVTDDETDEAVVGWLLERVEHGQPVAVQLHGGGTDAYDPLAGRTELHTIRPYVAGRPPEDERRARELIRRIADREIDVVTFTSPGAARNLFQLAREMGTGTATEVDDALGGDVAVAVVGPVTGRVLAERGVAVAISPDRHRQGALVRAIERWHASG